MQRESWRSRTGFILAAIGSAIGLANIVSFPYMAGNNGGAAFLMVYLLCLALIGFPVFVAEALIGRTAQSSPAGSFRLLGRSKLWTAAGLLIVLTGLIVSSFYAAVAGWIFGYLIEAARGSISHFNTVDEAADYFTTLVNTPLWAVGFHFAFITLCGCVVYAGVRNGIERASKFMMPALFAVLIYLAFYGLSLPGAGDGLRFLFSPDWHQVTPKMILVALGQSFFTLSAGQGTMITYGSYLSKKENLVTGCLPIALADTLISILASIAVFTVVFSAGVSPDGGLDLVFRTLPVVFGKIPAGYLVGVLFFLLVTIAALTSEISAMEPVIAYLVDEWKWPRQRAVIAVVTVGFIIGIPCALSGSLLAGCQPFGMSILDAIMFLALDILVPIGGLLAVLLVGWRWGLNSALPELALGTNELFERRPWIAAYFRLCLKYVSPALIVVVFLRAMGVI